MNESLKLHMTAPDSIFKKLFYMCQRFMYSSDLLAKTWIKFLYIYSLNFFVVEFIDKKIINDPT